MAITTNGEAVRLRGRWRARTALSDINVTPFVDVLLVLLVIFMLTAHVMEFGIEIDVPKVRLQRESAKELPVIQITKTGELYLNENPVNINQLVATIRKRFGRAPQVYLRADRQATWDAVVQVMAELGEAKIPINAVTKPEDVTGRRRR